MKTATDKSVILILFEAIETALSAFLTANVIKSVEIWNGQSDNEYQERPRNYPYVTVEINVDWESMRIMNQVTQLQNVKQNVQNGNATVTIHLICESLKTETEAFKALEPIRFQVHRALNMLKDNDYFSHLQRKTTPTIPAHGRVFDLMTTYNCNVIEAAGQFDSTEIELLGFTINSDLEITNKPLNVYTE